MKHIKIDAGLKLFPKKYQAHVIIFGDILVLGFAIYIAITGFQMVMLQVEMQKVSPALHLPLQYVNAAPMVGFALASIRQLQTIIHRIGIYKRGGEQE